MLRLLGEPKWSRTTSGEGEEHGTTWNHYEGIGEFPGLTNVANDRRTSIITRIEFFPNRLSKAQAIAHFGRGYLMTRYAFDPCEHDEDSEPIYESPNCPLVIVEYRARGIAVSVGDKDMVTRISHVDGPIGSTKSRCNP